MLDILDGDEHAEDDIWAAFLIFGVEIAFCEPVLVVVSKDTPAPSLLKKDFVDTEKDLAAAKECFEFWFGGNKGKEESDKATCFFSMMPKALFSKDGSEQKNNGEKGYIIAKVDEDYVSAFFGGRIE